MEILCTKNYHDYLRGVAGGALDGITNSIKIYNLINTIKNTEGIVFIYSQYLSSGVIPIALALEEYGFSRHPDDGNPLLISAKSKKKGKNKKKTKTRKKSEKSLYKHMYRYVNIYKT